jgi:hypothetical protein
MRDLLQLFGPNWVWRRAVSTAVRVGHIALGVSDRHAPLYPAAPARIPLGFVADSRNWCEHLPKCQHQHVRAPNDALSCQRLTAACKPRLPS